MQFEEDLEFNNNFTEFSKTVAASVGQGNTKMKRKRLL